MLDGIDALVALHTFGTVSEAAVRLRLTQSAVSKRIQTLQTSVGIVLVVPDGRRLRLTPQAVELLERARPLVAELRGLVQPLARPETTRFSLALADSIASSWGPAAVRKALGPLPRTQLALHAHRTILVVESVRLGRYDLGLCTEPPSARDLVMEPLADEPMVVAHSYMEPRAARSQPLITIEPSAATWRAIHPRLIQLYPRLLAAPLVHVESFGAVLQMARAGFGNGILPLGLAAETLPRAAFHPLAGVRRRVVLLTRKTVYQMAGFKELAAELRAAAAELLRFQG
jgi:DNA-binding transcriptional LysR family regulator